MIGTRQEKLDSTGLKKPSLVLVSPGPKYDPIGFYQSRLETLTDGYEGVVLTSSPTPLRSEIGGFQIIAKRFHAGKLREFISFLVACTRLSQELAQTGRKVDLVVSYDPLKSGILALFLKRQLGAKFAVEINGIYDDPANYADTRNRLIARLKCQLYKGVEAFVIRRADGIKLLFDGQVDSFLEPGATKSVIRSFANLVNVVPFLSCPADITKKRVLFVGYPHFLKGVDILIAAFSILFEEFPEWELTILGWYPDKRVIERALRGTRNITYHLPVPADKMPTQMASHSIFVLPSRAEAMGRVLIEAMGAGVARIGARQGGIPTVIEDGVDGLLFEKNNVLELASCLRILMGSEELRKSYGDAARERVTIDFSREKYLESINNFYGDVITADDGRSTE